MTQDEYRERMWELEIATSEARLEIMKAEVLDLTSRAEENHARADSIRHGQKLCRRCGTLVDATHTMPV